MTDKVDIRLNTDAAARAFEESKYYFAGESPVRRIEDWRVWIDAWNAALSSSQPKSLADEQILEVADAAGPPGPYADPWESRHLIAFARALLEAAK